MILRDKLIENVRTLIELGNGIIPLMQEQVPSALTFCDLKDEDKTEIQQKLQYFADIHQRHIGMLKSLKDDLKSSKKEGF